MAAHPTARAAHPTAPPELSTPRATSPTAGVVSRHASRRVLAAAAIASSALLAAACGSSSITTTPTTTTPAATTSPSSTSSSGGSAALTLSSFTDPALASPVLSANGRALYMFSTDTSTHSSCSGSCAAVWPPLVATTTPAVSGAAKSSLLGSVKRAGGSNQVTYNGHPVYEFSGDSGAGQVNGQGINSFGGHWSAITASGSADTASSAGGSSTTTSGGGYYG